MALGIWRSHARLALPTNEGNSCQATIHQDKFGPLEQNRLNRTLRQVVGKARHSRHQSYNDATRRQLRRGCRHTGIPSGSAPTFMSDHESCKRTVKVALKTKKQPVVWSHAAAHRDGLTAAVIELAQAAKAVRRQPTSGRRLGALGHESAIANGRQPSCSTMRHSAIERSNRRAF